MKSVQPDVLQAEQKHALGSALRTEQRATGLLQRRPNAMNCHALSGPNGGLGASAAQHATVSLSELVTCLIDCEGLGDLLTSTPLAIKDDTLRKH